MRPVISCVSVSTRMKAKTTNRTSVHFLMAALQTAPFVCLLQMEKNG